MVRFAFILMVAVSSASGILSICLANGPSQSKQQALPPGAILRLGEAGKKAGAGQFRNLVFLQHKSLIVLGRQDGIRFYEFPSGRLKFMFSNKEVRTDFGVTPDARFLLARTPDAPGIGFFDVVGKKFVRKFNALGISFSEHIRCSPDQKSIACATFSGNVYLTNIRTLQTKVSKQHRQIADIAFSGDGRFLAVADASSLVPIWRTNGFRFHREFPVPGREIYKNRVRTGAVSLSHDGDLLAAGCYTGTFVWHVPSRKLIFRAKAGYNKLSPDGRLLANIRIPQGIELWEICTAKQIALIKPGKNISQIVWSADGRYLCSIAIDHEVLVWDLTKLASLQSKDKSEDTSEKIFSGAWDALKDPKANNAYRAISRLAANHQTAVTAIRQQLRPVAVKKSKAVTQLIEGLGAATKQESEDAAQRLAKMGSNIKPLLVQAQEKHASKQVRAKAEELLRFLEYIPPTPEEIRQIRAIQALQWIGGKESIHLLQQLSHGDPVARQTQEAKLALEVIRADSTVESK